MDVHVWHLVAGDQHTDSFAVECGLLRDTDPPGHVEDVGRQAVRRVDPVVDLVDRHDQDVSGGHRVDRHERHALVVAPDERAGNLAVDDAGEDRRHRPNLGRET